MDAYLLHVIGVNPTLNNDEPHVFTTQLTKAVQHYTHEIQRFEMNATSEKYDIIIIVNTAILLYILTYSNPFYCIINTVMRPCIPS